MSILQVIHNCLSEFVDDDWIKGRIGDKIGIFPRSYASFGDEDVEEELEEILDEETHSVNVFYDFEPGADDELSLSAGDMVTVISFVGDEWIKGWSWSHDDWSSHYFLIGCCFMMTDHVIFQKF